jgi:hypothetical protein
MKAGNVLNSDIFAFSNLHKKRSRNVKFDDWSKLDSYFFRLLADIVPTVLRKRLSINTPGNFSLCTIFYQKNENIEFLCTKIKAKQ